MTLEIAEAAKALGLDIPVEEDAKVVMQLLGKLKESKPRARGIETLFGKVVTKYEIPVEFNEAKSVHSVSINELGGQEKIRSGLVLWGSGYSGNEPAPLTLALVKVNAGGPKQPSYIPLSQYDIARYSVVTGLLNFDSVAKDPHPQSVSPTGRIFVRGTVR